MPNYPIVDETNHLVVLYLQTKGKVAECQGLIDAIAHRMRAHEAGLATLRGVFVELIDVHANSQDEATQAMVERLRRLLAND